MSNKQQTAVKLYTEEQLLNTAEAIRDYLKNYPEKFHESMIKKHLINLAPIELPSDDEITNKALEIGYTNNFKINENTEETKEEDTEEHPILLRSRRGEEFIGGGRIGFIILD